MDLSEPAHLWCTQKDPKQWCRSHFNEAFKCDVWLNNLNEAFNKAILLARDKPVLTMLDRIPMYGQWYDQSIMDLSEPKVE